jgi:hypothetical protein
MPSRGGGSSSGPELVAPSSVGHRVFGPLSDDVVAAIGWSGYFIACAVLVLPGVALVRWATRVAERMISSATVRQST